MTGSQYLCLYLNVAFHSRELRNRQRFCPTEVPRGTRLKSGEVTNIIVNYSTTTIIIITIHQHNCQSHHHHHAPTYIIIIYCNSRTRSRDWQNFAGFVLKSRSDEAPVRRRSLVERTGMKNLMQVGALSFRDFFRLLCWHTFIADGEHDDDDDENDGTMRMMTTMWTVITLRTVMMMMMKLTRMCNSECRLSG